MSERNRYPLVLLFFESFVIAFSFVACQLPLLFAPECSSMLLVRTYYKRWFPQVPRRMLSEKVGNTLSLRRQIRTDTQAVDAARARSLFFLGTARLTVWADGRRERYSWIMAPLVWLWIRLSNPCLNRYVASSSDSYAERLFVQNRYSARKNCL